jgi:hypothetical protein
VSAFIAMGLVPFFGEDNVLNMRIDPESSLQNDGPPSPIHIQIILKIRAGAIVLGNLTGSF